MDFEQRYRAMETRDESHAGEFFAAVTSTGHLLPAGLSGAHAEARERALLPDRGGGAQRRLPGLPLRCRPGRVTSDQNPAMKRSMFASRPAAIISRTEGTRSSATASWIFGAARAACSSIRRRCTPRSAVACSRS